MPEAEPELNDELHARFVEQLRLVVVHRAGATAGELSLHAVGLEAAAQFLRFLRERDAERHAHPRVLARAHEEQQLVDAGALLVEVFERREIRDAHQLSALGLEVGGDVFREV